MTTSSDASNVSRPVLFLLNPGFTVQGSGPHLCPECALIEGLLSYYPQLGQKLNVQRVDFVRPRRALTSLLGEANQACPALVFHKTQAPAQATAGDFDYAFISGAKAIIEHLAAHYGVSSPRPESIAGLAEEYAQGVSSSTGATCGI